MVSPLDELHHTHFVLLTEEIEPLDIRSAPSARIYNVPSFHLLFVEVLLGEVPAVGGSNRRIDEQMNR
jgi:hypothetical protein